VRGRNILNTLMMSFLLMGIVGVTWILGAIVTFYLMSVVALAQVLDGVGTTDYLQGRQAEVVSCT